MNEGVPFLDLISPHREREDEFLSVVREALRSASFIGGPEVENFEREFADFCGSRCSIGVGSGTDALRFALIAAGVKQGDTVVTVPFTFIATTEAIAQAGARPAFVDIDPRTYNMDPRKLREFLETYCELDEKTGKTIHSKTRSRVSAVVPVHLYGQTADMNAISRLAERFGMVVIEDACQAHGASYYSEREKRWKKAGTAGIAAAFSFYPGKNLGACGEAGAVTTDDPELAARVRMLRDHGQIKKYVHTIEGYNGRLDAIQAGILRVKLRHLSEWNEQRRILAHRYNKLLGEAEWLIFPYEPEWARGVYHLYAVRVSRRAELQAFLAEKKIATGLHYPIPLHLQQAYSGLGYCTGDFPAAEKIASEVLSLPMFPGLTEEQQDRVAKSVMQFGAPIEKTVSSLEFNVAG